MDKKICNACGYPATGEALDLEKAWGFFSEKDGEIHRFCLCEKCYNRIIKGFVIPVSIKEQAEII